MGSRLHGALIVALGVLLLAAPAWGARPSPIVLEASIAAPALTAPDSGACGLPTQLTLSWARVPEATSYHLQVSLLSTFSIVQYDVPAIHDTSHAIQVQPKGKYYWRVSASGLEGSGPWSRTWVFVTTFVPPATSPTLLWPPDGTVNALTNQQFRWTAVPGATRYELQFCDNPSFSHCSGTIPDIQDTTRGVGLGEFIHRYWRVRGTTPAGPGPYSTAWSFTTGARRPSPVAVAPAQDTTLYTGEVTFAWRPVADAPSYRLQVATDFSLYHLVLEQTGLQDTCFTASFVGIRSYYWMVCAMYDLGPGWGSGSHRFTICTSAPAAPALTSPPNGAREVTCSPVLDWNAAAGAVSYRLQVSRSVSFATKLVDRSLTGSSCEVELPEYLGTFWRVNATNPLGTSAWSPVWIFTTGRRITSDDDGGPSRAPTDDGPPEVATEAPPAFGIRLAAPNPVAGDLALEVALPRASAATLAMFDLAGRRVLARSIGYLGAGRHVLSLDEGRRLPNGVYVLRLTRENESASVRVIVLR